MYSPWCHCKFSILGTFFYVSEDVEVYETVYPWQIDTRSSLGSRERFRCTKHQKDKLTLQMAFPGKYLDATWRNCTLAQE